MTYLIRIILLAFNLYFARKTTFTGNLPVEIIRELRREKRKHVQQKFFTMERFRKGRINRRFKNTKPKDHRFSNQKSLRRMYRNS